MSPLDDGVAVDYLAVAPATPVYASDETQVGKVVEVLDNSREHIFDGLVIELSDGSRRFVDAPEVARTAERGVTLTIDPGQVSRLDPPTKGSGSRGGFKRRLFGGH